jgi:hypothetical protein
MHLHHLDSILASCTPPAKVFAVALVILIVTPDIVKPVPDAFENAVAPEPETV